MNRIGKNATYNFGGIAVGIFVLLIATPIYIRFLGIDQFGLFTLITSITAPLGVLNAGISQSATKFVAQYVAIGDFEKAAEAVQTSAFLNLGFGIAGCFILVLLAPSLSTSVFKIPKELHSSAIVAFRIAGLIWFATQMGLTYQAVLAGVQKFETIAVYNAAQSILMYGIGSLLLFISPSIISVLLLSLAVSVAYWMLWYIKAQKAIAGVSLAPQWHKGQAKQTWAFSGWQIFNALLSLLGNHADRLLLATLKGTGLVGVYGIALSIQARLLSLVWGALSTLFPAASAASGVKGESESLVLNYGWLFSVLGIGLYGTTFILAKDFLVLWLGIKLGTQAAPVLRVLLLVAFLGLPSAVLYHYLLGHGLTKWSSLGNLATSFVTVVLAWIFITYYGLLGAAWSGVFGILTTRPIFHVWVLRKNFRVGNGITRSFSLLYSSQVSGSIIVLLGWLFYSQSITFTFIPLRLLAGFFLLPAFLIFGTLSVERFLFKHPFSLWQVLYKSLKNRKRLKSL